MNPKTNRIAFAVAAVALTLAGCGGGGQSPAGSSGTGGDFVLLRVTPPDNAKLFLNDSIQFDFSTPVDLTTADLNAISFSVFDLTGRPLGEQPRGIFRLARTPGDADVGRRLEFVPLLPTDDLFTNGGFKPGRRYLVQLVGGDRRNGAVLRDVSGKEMKAPISFNFSTVDGSSPAELFRNTKLGGPRRTSFDVHPATTDPVTRELIVDPSFANNVPLEIRLGFDQPLNPQRINVPSGIELNPVLRDRAKRGRVYLEYDDPAVGGKDTWIPADVDLESNSLDGATVVLRPQGALPNNAQVRVIVTNAMEDMSGESNVADQAYSSQFGTFRVQGRHAPQFDAMVERFEALGQVDLAAPFTEPVAEVGEGYLRASLAFEGSDTSLDFDPADLRTVLNTDFTQVRMRSGRVVNVAGGVFEFKNVRIPLGYEVIGEGSKPMVWLITGDLDIAGTLHVNGSDGEVVRTTNADAPALGGVGQCGGGDGGRGSVNVTARTDTAEPGFGPGNIAGGGGEGGRHSCQGASGNICRIGSGGGGGSFASKGDPDFYTRFLSPVTNPPTDVSARGGDGRVGCQNKNPTTPGVVPGGAGPVGFIDPDENNNFVGTALRFTAGAPSFRASGELAAPRGGAGGGGGGDGATDCANTSQWRTDAKGGGGGGAAGVLIIKCLGRVKIRSSGLITANGGTGGGGAPNGASGGTTSSSAGGGGGAGSGGMVVIMAPRIDMVKHGETYTNAATAQRANGAYSFAVMADGNVGIRSPYALMPIRGKYPTAYQAADRPETVGSWQNDVGDQPTGGFGGNGIVQLLTPSANDSDATGSFFDDNIFVYDDNAALDAGTPAAASVKVSYLGWRGYSDGAGGRQDDRGAVLTVPRSGFGMGDIKPPPILLPLPYGPKTRVRSRLIDLGRVDREPTNVAQGVRAINEQGSQLGDPFTNLMRGPTYLFAGTTSDTASRAQGYIAYDDNGVAAFPVVAGSEAAIGQIDAAASFNGRPAYKVTLAQASAVLGQIPGRYTGYVAQLINGSTPTPEYRVLGHDDVTVYLDARGGALPATVASTIRLVAKFFQVETDGQPGLGPTTAVGNRRVPRGNTQIGFAFYRDPRDPATRHPATGFEYGLNLDRPELMRTIRDGRYRYVQYDVVFNMLFSESIEGNVDPSRNLTPSTPRPALRELALPFQF